MDQKITRDSCEMLGDFFAISAHATRMRIFCELQNEARTVTEIAEAAGISITNASQHLRLMRDRGAVIADKRGQKVYYRIADQRILKAMQLIRESLTERLRVNAEMASIQGPRRVTRRAFNLRKDQSDASYFHSGAIV